MNIAIVNYTDQGGGAELMAMSLLKGYCKQGHDARMFVAVRQTKHRKVFQIPEPGILKGWLHNRNQKAGINSSYSTALQQVFKQHNFEPEVLHLHNLHGGYFNIKELKELTQRYTTLWTLHDSWAITAHCAAPMDCTGWHKGCSPCPHPQRFPAMDEGKTKSEFRLKRTAIEEANMQVICVAKHQQAIVQQAFPGKKTALIPNGIDLEIFKPGNKSDARAKLGIPPTAFILLLNGKYTLKNTFRNLAALLQVAKQFEIYPEVQFRVCGMSKSKQFAKTPNVDSLWYVENSAMPTWYQAADVFFHPALAESHSLSIMEAMACGLPLLTSDLPAYESAFLNGKEGFKGNTIEDFGEKLMLLFQDSALRAELSKNAIQKSATFDWNTCLQAYLSLIEAEKC